MNTLYRLLIVLCCGFCASALSADDAAPDYRAWQHVKTMIIQPEHALADTFGGIHHIYANTQAMAGLSQGRYQNGAVFVFDLKDYETQDNTIVEADRKRLDVMRYDLGQFEKTGGWDFASYLPEQPSQRIAQDVVSGCFECHKAMQSSGFVFSKYRP